MTSLTYVQNLELLGPYFIAPGETVWLAWYYPTPKEVSSFPSVQPYGTAMGIGFTIESTTVWVSGDGDAPSTIVTNYGIWVSNNAAADGEMLEVNVVSLSAYY